MFMTDKMKKINHNTSSYRLANLDYHTAKPLCHHLYSGPWQVMLKQGDGSYACVAESASRFTLGEVSIIPPSHDFMTLSSDLHCGSKPY